MNAPEERSRVWPPTAAALALAVVAHLSLGPDLDPSSELTDRLAHAAAYGATRHAKTTGEAHCSVGRPRS